jgi:hypothetical protein
MNAVDGLEDLDDLDDKSLQQRLSAVQRDGLNLRFIRDKTDDICRAALAQNGLALQFIPEAQRYTEFCEIAVQQCSAAFQFVPLDKRTLSICQSALKGELKN